MPLRRPQHGLARIAAALALLLTLLVPAVHAQEDESGSSPFAYRIEALNAGLEPARPPLRLDTPRAALESFLDAIRRDRFARAGHVLNLDAIPPEEQAARAPDLALMLAYLLQRHDLIDWSEIPDQPDARVLPTVQQSMSPYSRRSVELGTLELEGRPVQVSLQRFQARDAEPVWLFSPFVVERVSALYAQERPGLLADWVSLERRLDTLGRPSAWEWSAAAALLLASVALWFGVYYGLRALGRRTPTLWRRDARHAAWPFATLVAALAFRLGTEHLILLTGPVASNLDVASEVIALFAGVWLLLRLVDAGTRRLSERYVVPLTADDPENRRTKTTVYVVRRLAVVLIALVGVGWVLLKVGLFDSFGLSILASAGALGVLVAIAARPLFGNMVSGLQIALTDPLRIGDVVVYDGHWSTVEDISFAHTVLRTWTDTRLIVPHTDFLARPFENWSKEGEAVKRIVKLAVDYRLDVGRVRAKLAEILRHDPRLTGEAPLVEMVETEGEHAVLWIWLPGIDALSSWYLHNEVREKLYAWLQELDGGAYLPRRRLQLLDEDRARAARGPAAGSVPLAERAGRRAS
ncbi:mechanosensitive ion channel family protein [Salinarimonas rosea]|uniref:mechanosensitive ion channel family protein n=1 Tax=Salinarimonas rosea TaxID=552063 RepID=UPI00040B9324|nr:mechanosensitive ion channel domain-containing protein [Salinarimonas rosea]